MYGFARPLPPDRRLWERAEAGDRQTLFRELSAAAGRTGPKTGYIPALQVMAPWERRGADVWKTTGGEHRRFVGVECEVNIDGRGWLFCGRAAERLSGGDLAIFEQIIAGNFASFLSIMAAFYGAASYHGHVDVGLAVVGIEGGVSGSRRALDFYGQDYGAPTYTPDGAPLRSRAR